MSLKVLIIAAVVAVAKAGHLLPPSSYATSYVSHAPVAPIAPTATHIPNPVKYVVSAPVVSTIPQGPPPLITTSYGYTTKSLGTPSVSYKVQPAVHTTPVVHAAPAPIIHAAPAPIVHTAPASVLQHPFAPIYHTAPAVHTIHTGSLANEFGLAGSRIGIARLFPPFGGL